MFPCMMHPSSTDKKDGCCPPWYKKLYELFRLKSPVYISVRLAVRQTIAAVVDFRTHRYCNRERRRPVVFVRLDASQFVQLIRWIANIVGHKMTRARNRVVRTTLCCDTFPIHTVDKRVLANFVIRPVTVWNSLNCLRCNRWPLQGYSRLGQK